MEPEQRKRRLRVPIVLGSLALLTIVGLGILGFW
jgi:hypothetical protein